MNDIMKIIRFIQPIIFPFLMAIFSSETMGESPVNMHLGPYTIGQSLEDINKINGPLNSVGANGMYYKDHWTYWFDEQKKTLTGVSFNSDIVDTANKYPMNDDSITIGSMLKDVENVYGDPENKYTAHTSFILRNSELGLIYIYPSRGLYFSFINLNPYTSEKKWTVQEINVGTKEVMSSRTVGLPVYARKWISQEGRDSIISNYHRKYGANSDLQIYDDYINTMELGYFNYIKSLGGYRITFLKIFPKDDIKALELFSGCDEHSFISYYPREIKLKAVKATASKNKISTANLEKIIAKVEEYKNDLLSNEIREEMMKRFPSMH
jgi:hypothetical protein